MSTIEREPELWEWRDVPGHENAEICVLKEIPKGTQPLLVALDVGSGKLAIQRMVSKLSDLGAVGFRIKRFEDLTETGIVETARETPAAAQQLVNDIYEKPTDTPINAA